MNRRCVVAGLVLVVSTAGCGLGKAAVHDPAGVRILGQDAESLARTALGDARPVGNGGLRLPGQVPVLVPGSVKQHLPTVTERVADLARAHLAGLTEEDAKALVSAACEAKDLVDLQKEPTLDKAVGYVLGKGSPSLSYGKVRALAADLSNSSSPTLTLASFVVCAAAG